MDDMDQARVQILSRPVPSDTRAAAEISRAIPLPKDMTVELPSAEQTKVLGYGQFAPIAARVFNNATKQKETHWTLHPWDVARLADQASADLYQERRIRVEPRLIAGAYFTESSGVVQVGFDRKGVELLNKGKSIDEVVKSGAKASFGLFQIDQQHAGATDLDPVRGAKKAAEFLAEAQENLKRYPQLGMLAVSATYNASSSLRAKIFTGAEMDARELESFEGVRSHAASMAYGAALYDVAHRTYRQHLAQAHKMGVPVAVAADTVKRADPLQGERVGAVLALTGRTLHPADQAATPPPPAVATPSVPTALVVSVGSPPPSAPNPAPSAYPSRSLSTVAGAKASAPTKPSLRDAIKVAAAGQDQPKAARTAPSSRSDGALQRASRALGAQPVDHFILGVGPRPEARITMPERATFVPAEGPSAERAKEAFEASVAGWKSGAAAVLSRVAAFHEQRTREMAGQRDGP
ncbi:hypothetical protein LJR175_008354 [Variovorax sp. LjRoot175]|uniref:hypothetical protein n=1 Tax=Variovorax sp. LjRoot175 TaxID=3342276 RepID=UPI003ECF592E